MSSHLLPFLRSVNSLFSLLYLSLAAIPKAVVALMHVAGEREGYEERMESLFVITANEIDR